ncbi:MAG: hypothetical protein QM714_19125 [Nocardioides sp.]|uniref:hypothetical protein n=1 Tax=Nocardioides sp. TaxID=35761 RepID=UPI0039E21755
MTAPSGEVVELRVHGVHGTSPQSMLGLRSDQVAQVAGDRLTGIFRARPGVALPLRDLADTRVSVEAYSWGALTSGARGALGWVWRALWLLLLPFALANLSYWARVRLHEDSGTARWGARATRLGAVLLTVFMVLTSCLVGIDLISWQCYRGDSPGCALPRAFDFMAQLDATQRIAVGCGVPLAVILVLWALSRATLARYEACTGAPAPASTGGVLEDPRLWRGMTRTRQLQRIHLTVALWVVVAFSGVHVYLVGSERSLRVGLTVATATALAGTAVCWCQVVQRDDIDYFPEHTSPVVRLRRRLPTSLRRWLRDQLPLALLGAMAAVTVVHLIVLLTLPETLDESRDFVGHNLWFIGVFVALTAVHLSVFTGGRMRPRWAIAVILTVFALAGVALALHLHSRWVRDGTPALVVGGIGLAALWLALVVWHFRQRERFAAVAWNGAGASVMLAAAAWVALLFTTGVVTGTATYLNGRDHGVADLVSRSSVVARAAAEPTSSERGGTPRYAATGEVMARHAIIHRSADGPVLTAGSLQMTTLLDAADQKTGAEEGLARAVTSTRVDTAEITLPSRLLLLEDSCLRGPARANDTTCSAEDPDFVAGGALAAPRRLVTVAAPGDPVTLAVTDPPARPLVVPQVLIWSPMFQLLWLLLVAVFFFVAVIRFRGCLPALDQQLEADIPIPIQAWTAAQKARRTAAFAHRAERLLDGIGAITAFLALLLIALSSVGEPPWDLWPWTRNLATLSMYVVLLLGLALLLLASQLRNSDGARRGVGVVWDLATFWPRAAHPLAPPCYAERVVPEVHTRLNWALHSSPGEENLVVLSGHSQGSAIVAAVVSRLSPDDLRRVRVITYGSQLRAFYGRVFPQVLGPDRLGYLPTRGVTRLGDAFPDAGNGERATYHPPRPAPPTDAVDDSGASRPLLDRVFGVGGDWANLFRRTDPLGFRVFSDADASPDHWVPEVPPESAGDPGAVVHGHSYYQHSGEYRLLVAGWTGETVVSDPVGTIDIPPLPEP